MDTVSSIKERVIELDRKILKQLPNIRREIRDLEQEVAFIQKKIDAMRKNQEYATVVGSREDLTIGPIKVRGHPKGYEKKISELQRKKALINDKKMELLKIENEAVAYINSIQESSLRRILRFRYINGLSWQQVAVKMGPMYTADSCRMAHKRFMSG